MEKLEKKLLSAMAKASSDFRMLEPGDRVMVAVSGGKDSHAMLYSVARAPEEKRRSTSRCSRSTSTKVTRGFRASVLPAYFEREGYEYVIVKEDTYAVVTEKIPEGKTYCSLVVLTACDAASCTRRRRSSARPKSRSATIATT